MERGRMVAADVRRRIGAGPLRIRLSTSPERDMVALPATDGAGYFRSPPPYVGGYRKRWRSASSWKIVSRRSVQPARDGVGVQDACRAKSSRSVSGWQIAPGYSTFILRAMTGESRIKNGWSQATSRSGKVISRAYWNWYVSTMLEPDTTTSTILVEHGDLIL